MRGIERLTALPAGMVDVHTHAIDPDLPDVGQHHPGAFPRVERLAADRLAIYMDGRLYREVDERAWSLKARLQDMDAEGVAAQLLSAMPGTLCHEAPSSGAAALATLQNDFLARMVDACPRRFSALGAVPLQDVELAITELRRCVLDLGFVGVEIGTRVGHIELADPALRPFFHAAAALGVMVFVHPVDRTLDPRLTGLGLGFGLGMPLETAVAAAGVLTSDLLVEIPELVLVLAHGGGALPSVLPRVDFGQHVLGQLGDGAVPPLAGARALWSDSLTYDPAALRLTVERFGRDHVLLGTDYPFTAREVPPGRVLQGDAAPFDPRLVAAVSRDNALALMSRRRVPDDVPERTPQ